MFRREFLRTLAVFAAGLSSRAMATGSTASDLGGTSWSNGRVRHLLPAVSHDEFLIKASFDTALKSPPSLMVDDTVVAGENTDTVGEMWQFRAGALEADRRYRLSLNEAEDAGGRPLCDAWELATFPDPDSQPAHVRVLFFTCAGGHEQFGFLPVVLRNRLLRRALSFSPDAAVANGDHVYWDLRAPRTSTKFTKSTLGLTLGGTPDRSLSVLGTDNEQFLKNTAGPQIVPIYGTDFRSTPVYFIQDDHDYYDNDEATDRIVTFPPDHFMSEMARATQRLYYPEFLPDPQRPSGLPGASRDGEAQPVSESFGTLRYGRLLEALLYTVRRTMTMSGPSAVFLEDTVEKWLVDRMASTGLDHVINVPSNPAGWTAGKWGEWYPDSLVADGSLTLSPPKRYWQSGWVAQHDRLLAAMSAMKDRIPLTISGDLHASALGRILRTGVIDLAANPVIAMLCGTIGTGDRGWPSRSRGTVPQPSLHIDMNEVVKPIEQHGFTLADFTPDKVKLRMFKWDRNTQPEEAIDSLEPFHEAELVRPSS